MIEVLYRDSCIAVCIKPAGVLSTDEPGGMPEILRAELGAEDVRSVHRLDRVVSGLMVYAMNPRAASDLGRQIREGSLVKEYLAVIHWRPRPESGVMRDLLLRSPAERKTHVVKTAGKGVQEAVLEYGTLASEQGMSLVRIKLITGRTHQIRAQFSSRGLPLVGDKKYSLYKDGCDIALFSCRLGFTHPERGEKMEFFREPEAKYPWDLFDRQV